MKSVLLFLMVMFLHLTADAQMKFTSKASGLGTITDITHAADGSKRIFVANKTGVITILDSNYTVLGTLLNIFSLISTQSEKGLLGLAFHPDFKTNGYFFVNYNPSGTNNTVIARFAASNPASNATVPNSTQKTIITITEAENGNHKAGDLAFGPDGYLYITTGDGGGGGDPQGSGQDGSTMLGKLLRVDINTTLPYVIPPTNPFVSNIEVLDEIWDLGLRNPWRISFDKETNDLWIADVGQGSREEINFEASGSTGGYNYGWNCREGFNAYNGCPNSASYTSPIFDYGHCSTCDTAGSGNSITGGFVYRGTKTSNAALRGYYVFADYVSRHAWLIKYVSGVIQETKKIAFFTPSGITSFGEMENGEILAGLDNGSLGLVESTTALPVRLSHFNANWVKPNVDIQWNSQTEINLQTYVVEKSINGFDFYSIGEVEALSNSNSPSNYKFKDLQVLPGKIYYRLKMVDRDGHVDYSSVDQVIVPLTESKVYYNAKAKEIWINLESNPGSADKLNLYTVQGKAVQNWNINGKPISVDHLAAGVYIVTLVRNGIFSTHKMMIY